MELNREQIVKALEICTDETTEFCTGCPFIENGGCKQSSLLKLALALIRELTEENAKLRFDVSSYKLERERNDSRSADLVSELAKEAEKNLKLTEEIERLTIDLEAMRGAANSYKMHYEAAKADTVRKMLERLNEQFRDEIAYRRSYIHEEIDQIAKEMLEGDKT